MRSPCPPIAAAEGQQDERGEGGAHETRAGDGGHRRTAEPPGPDRDAARVLVDRERLKAPSEQRRGEPVSELVGQRRHEDERPGEHAPVRDGVEHRRHEHADGEHPFGARIAGHSDEQSIPSRAR